MFCILYRLVFFCVASSLLLLFHGCSAPPTCNDDAVPSSFTVNPNGSPCKRKCECNNQSYEGFCSDKGVCDAVAREDCPKRGVQRGCRLRPAPGGGKCPAGLQVCGQNLGSLRWGDCVPLNKKEPETSKELCGDGIDNDCDGIIDKSDPDCKSFCNPGQVQPCYTGPEGTENKGVCASGTRLCNIETGQWFEACLNEVKPQSEVCNRKDDDCNGKIDDLSECVCEKEGSTEPCYGGPESTSFRGTCKTGVRTCEKKENVLRWSECRGQKLPSQEECNGKDDNCNGSIDEGCACAPGTVRSCGSPLGECRAGSQRCEGRVWSRICYAEVGPKAETCDSRDNNCNGLVDEKLQRRCESSCGKGVEVCKNGRWSDCSAPKSEAETCNKKDDDCNGLIDDLRRICKNKCGEGLEFCVEGRWMGCTAPKPKLEVCDGKDNDCNGSIDDNVVEIGAPCRDSKQKGICQQGVVQSCKNGVVFCESNTKPTLEVCDGKDNNCNGSIDEGAFLCVLTVAGTGKPGAKDGSALQAQFSSPAGLFWSPSVGLLIVDSGNHRIRQLSPSTGQVQTWAGTTRGFQDGAKASAKFNTPFGIVFDAVSGAWYITDTNNHRIRQVSQQGVVTTLAGSGKQGLDNHTQLLQSKWSLPKGILLRQNDLTVVDSGSGHVRTINLKTKVLQSSFTKEQKFVSFRGLTKYVFKEPIDLVFSSEDVIVVSDAGNHQVLLIDTKRLVVIAVGDGTPGWVNGSADRARFRRPMGLAVDTQGNFYVADSGNHCIRKITRAGVVTTLAGTDQPGMLDGLTSYARFHSPSSLVFDRKGDLYVSDSKNHKIRKIILSR